MITLHIVYETICCRPNLFSEPTLVLAFGFVIYLLIYIAIYVYFFFFLYFESLILTLVGDVFVVGVGLEVVGVLFATMFFSDIVLVCMYIYMVGTVKIGVVSVVSLI